MICSCVNMFTTTTWGQLNAFIVFLGQVLPGVSLKRNGGAWGEQCATEHQWSLNILTLHQYNLGFFHIFVPSCVCQLLNVDAEIKVDKSLQTISIEYWHCFELSANEMETHLYPTSYQEICMLCRLGNTWQRDKNTLFLHNKNIVVYFQYKKPYENSFIFIYVSICSYIKLYLHMYLFMQFVPIIGSTLNFALCQFIHLLLESAKCIVYQWLNWTGLNWTELTL